MATQNLTERYNHKLAQPDETGQWKLRIWHRQGRGRQSPRYLVKCGDCQNRLEIFYDEVGLEIGGVHASRQEWARLLGPLLFNR